MLGNNKQIVQSICAIVMFALAFWGIHYTSDWAAYRHYFDNPGESRDFFSAYCLSISRERIIHLKCSIGFIYH